MAATIERIEEYRTYNAQFCKRMFDFLSIMFVAQVRSFSVTAALPQLVPLVEIASWRREWHYPGKWPTSSDYCSASSNGVVLGSVCGLDALPEGDGRERICQNVCCELTELLRIQTPVNCLDVRRIFLLQTICIRSRSMHSWPYISTHSRNRRQMSSHKVSSSFFLTKKKPKST